METKKRPLVVISSCLMGQLVRYNKGHCADKWVLQELSKFVDFHPVCPEVEMGLGTPREEIHLYYEKDDKDNIKIKSKFANEDLTDLAKKTYMKMNKDLENLEIDAFILTKKSPSCGLDRVKTILKDRPETTKTSVGLFAKNIQDKFPNTPIIDSGRIIDKKLRENFIKSLFAHFRLRTMKPTPMEFQMYHQKYKYILMDHSASKLKDLGHIVSKANKENFNNSVQEYYKLFFSVLRTEPTAKTRFNTLQHLMGYFKKNLETDEKQYLIGLLDDCRNGLSNHLVAQKHFELLSRKYKVDYLNNQHYFYPYPKELKLLKDI